MVAESRATVIEHHTKAHQSCQLLVEVAINACGGGVLGRNLATKKKKRDVFVSVSGSSSNSFVPPSFSAILFHVLSVYFLPEEKY